LVETGEVRQPPKAEPVLELVLATGERLVDNGVRKFSNVHFVASR
jgi:hypothetical protein